MSYRHTLEAALESLHEIEDLVKGFPGNGKIAAVEIDLTLQKLRNVYELMLMLKTPQEEAAITAIENETKLTVVTIQDTQPEVKSQVQPKTITDATTPADGGVPDFAGPAPNTVHKESKSSREFQTLSDQFKGRKTLHESLHQNFAKEGETLRHAKPVSDLMSAIGINDRFTFIRELFNNDKSTFETTIKNLNEVTSFNDAYNLMIQHFNWDMDSEPVQLLLEIIRRKFITGRHE
jgi:hypothetical protein